MFRKIVFSTISVTRISRQNLSHFRTRLEVGVMTSLAWSCELRCWHMVRAWFFEAISNKRGNYSVGAFTVV
jgi:hypothetical protein